MEGIFESDSESEDFEGFTRDDLMASGILEDNNSETDVSVESEGSEDSESDEEFATNGNIWTTDARPVDVQPFREIVGPVYVIPSIGNASDFFNLLFSQELMELIVCETNRYAEQCILIKPDVEWKETTIPEMRAFLGLHVLFGIHQLPNRRLYWSKDPFLGVDEVKKVMPRNRFFKLCQYLHVNNKDEAIPRGEQGHDKLFKVRPVLNHVLAKCQTTYRIGQDISIDEAMVKFKGRSSLKQYLPMKPVKRGIKVWEAADPRNGFVSNFQVYTGKQDGGVEHGLGYRVVHDLTRIYAGKSHHVVCDNFFTSVKLAEDLLNDNLYLCGTTRANRREFPKELAPKQTRVKKLKQGESLFLRKGPVIATVWKDKRLVYFLSTQSNPVGDDTVQRKQRDGSIIEVKSCPVVKSYNHNMGGVDLSDQLRGAYSLSPKSMKWWRYLFWFCTDICIVNAFILRSLSPNHPRKLSHLEFRLELAKSLIGNFSSRRQSLTSSRIEGGHWPVEHSKGRCKRCLKRKRVTFCRMACSFCNQRVCLACFKDHIGDLA